MDSAKEETSAAQEVAWRLIGPVSELSNRQCRLIYSSLGYETDICLFHVRGEFFAMDARCSHSGGPLCDGDIEEADGVLQVFCPWHDYDFNLRTGRSNTGLQQQVHEVKLEDGSVFVKHIYGKPVDTREGPGYVSAFAVISGITRYLVHVCGVEMS